MMTKVCKFSSVGSTKQKRLSERCRKYSSFCFLVLWDLWAHLDLFENGISLNLGLGGMIHGTLLFMNCYFLLSPAFSKKSGGTLFLVFRGAWCVVRGAWRVARGAWRVARGAWFRVFSGYFVPLTPPTVSVQSFWNFTGVLRMVWRYACGFFRILK